MLVEELYEKVSNRLNASQKISYEDFKKILAEQFTDQQIQEILYLD